MSRSALRTRYFDVLASIYLYNEHRGYTSLYRALERARGRLAHPQDPDAGQASRTLSR